MNLKRKKIKMKIYLIVYILFIILTFVGAILVIMKKLDNAGYAVIPMLFGLVFAGLYRDCKKRIDDNK